MCPFVSGLSKFISTSEAFNDGVPCSDVVKKYLRSSPACEELLALLQPLETALKTPGVRLKHTPILLQLN